MKALVTGIPEQTQAAREVVAEMRINSTNLKELGASISNFFQRSLTATEAALATPGAADLDTTNLVQKIEEDSVVTANLNTKIEELTNSNKTLSETIQTIAESNIKFSESI